MHVSCAGAWEAARFATKVHRSGIALTYYVRISYVRICMWLDVEGCAVLVRSTEYYVVWIFHIRVVVLRTRPAGKESGTAYEIEGV
jgi:hypothetical protein